MYFLYDTSCNYFTSSRDLGYINKEQDCVDVVTLIADGLRKLDSQFESLVRFEEIIMKKLRDAELRLANLKKSQEVRKPVECHVSSPLIRFHLTVAFPWFLSWNYICPNCYCF